jgi:hypothetical protein
VTHGSPRQSGVDQPRVQPFAAAGQPTIVRRLQWAILAGIGLVAMWLNVLLYNYAGAFWRDEASTLRLATVPQWETLWAWLSKDSFPGLFSSLLRLWVLIGPGDTDDSARLFGTLIGLGLVAAVCVAGWMLSERPPLMAGALVATNTTLLYFASSIRAYGLAALLIVLCCAAFWRMVRQPTRTNVAASLVLAVLSAHANYQNACLLLGLGVAGSAVCAVCRLWTRAAVVLGVCFVAAASLLVYLGIIAEYRQIHAVVAGTTVAWSTIIMTFLASLGGQSTGLAIVWAALAVLAGGYCTVAIVRLCRYAEARQAPSLPLFCVMAIVVSAAAGLVFFRFSGMVPKTWYFLPFIASAAVLLDAALTAGPQGLQTWAPLLVAPLIVALGFPEAWAAAHTRRTNVDVVSQIVAYEAGPQDLVLIDPFFNSPSFDYYYHGRAAWSTLPMTVPGPILGICPFDAIRPLMSAPKSIAPTLAKIEATLAAGHRLWIVGELATPPDGRPAEAPPPFRPRPDWTIDDYSWNWSLQVSHQLRTRARTASRIAVPVAHPVSPLEEVSLTVFEGWRDHPADTVPR